MPLLIDLERFAWGARIGVVAGGKIEGFRLHLKMDKNIHTKIDFYP